MLRKFFRKLERFEYYNSGPFWSIAVGSYFMFNLFTGQFEFLSSPPPPINSQCVGVLCRGGDFLSNPLPTGHHERPPVGDRGPDREFPATQHYGSPGQSGNSGGSSNSDSWEQEQAPEKSNYKPDPNYWKQFHPQLKTEKEEDEESCLIDQKGGYDNLLIDLSAQNHRYEINSRSARAELEVIAKDPKARKMLTNGLDRIKNGKLTAIQQKELKGFKRLKEYKFGRRGIRVIVDPGKKGAPDTIVGIVRRDRATPFIKSLRDKFETTK
uniref:hypothetical protein n=1 Tax=Navicula tsukamotoi TaxID=2018706 RepID=UPI002181F9E6|nr:hypothetical protein NDC64_pgp075 [Navicula tsukamotoi]UVG41733.1 hypothetical protein [Navicula tsukamotoi]UVG41877.1 hypothetical protein [Navicula tsukamotoi]